MTRRIVAIDCGTTATKAWVVADGQVVAGERATGGVRDLARIGGRDRDWLGGHVRAVAERALSAVGLGWGDVEGALAFGMVTSELGLEEIPHLPAPMSFDDLVTGLRVGDRGLLPTALRFVPGVICEGDGGVVTTDFMRGEETEVTGLLTLDGRRLPLLFVSPGSHTKFVVVDGSGRISWSLTTLTGEMLWALSQETILTGLVDPADPEVDVRAVDRGAGTATRYGLSRALYAARLLSRVEGASETVCSSFVLGGAASCDLAALRAARDDGVELPGEVCIADGPPMSTVYGHLLGSEAWVSRVEVVREPLGALGAWALHRASTDGADGQAAGTADASAAETGAVETSGGN